MKILITSGTFRLGASGPSTYLFNLCQRLIKKGHEISIVTYGEESGESREHSFAITRIPRGLPVVVRIFRFIFAVLAEGRNCDLLFINDYGIPATIANFFLRKPTVMKIVGDFAWEYSIRHQWIDSKEDIDDFQKKRYSLKVNLLKKIQGLYARRADLVIAPSNYFKKLVNGWGVPEERIRAIYNAVELNDYVVNCSKATARRKLNLTLDAKIILTVARLAPWKGVDVVIKLLPAMSKDKTCFLVLGEGFAKEGLEKLIKEKRLEDRVSFCGETSHKDIPYYLRAADVLVLYSGYEGFSHVILEAMAAGLPIVASEKGGNPEAVEDGISGFLVPWQKEGILRAKITMILKNRKLAEKFAKRAKEKVKEFGWQNLLERTTEIFEEAIIKSQK